VYRDLFLPLEMVCSGECAEVADVCGDPGWVSRMAELGLRVGCRLRVLRQGQPCLLELDGCRLSLRSDSSTQILVRPLLAS
jgi:Fe2+ transport system protein FeoA